jgi:cbb3-type cytochrome oxidase maturation protein
MDILFILIPLSLMLVLCGIWAFFWAVDAGQFDDLESPGWDALSEDPTGNDTVRTSHAAERSHRNGEVRT